jgi:[ribosomal protein S5]-alanine N-acetyltransferase
MPDQAFQHQELMKPILTTARLLLREFSLLDAPFILELVNTPGWLQFIGDRGIETIGAAEAYLANGPIQSYSVHGFGLWCVCRIEDGSAVGMCGLLKREPLEHPDLGFALLPDAYGMDYAREAASATLAYAREGLGILKVLAIATQNNTRSIHLLKKLGFQFEGMHRQGDEELMMFAIVYQTIRSESNTGPSMQVRW